MNFLSTNDWAITSLGISSVISFGSDINESHQHILPLCLPTICMDLFQCRVSRQIFRGKDSESRQDNSDEEDNFILAYRLCIQFDRYYSSEKKFIKDILPSSTTITIKSESYIIEMPTQDGRTATVIFRPGLESLKDIRYMMSGGGDDQFLTKTLKRSIVSAGGSVKFYCNPLSLVV